MWALLFELLTIMNTGRVFDLISGQLGRKPGVYRPGLYAFYPGSSPYLLVAHVDTVNNGQKRVKPVQTGHVIKSGNRSALGADDRAGVFAVLKIAESLNFFGLFPSLLFTDGEEQGGRGAWAFCDDYPQIFNDYHVVFELDRRGGHDWVNYAEYSQVAPQWPVMLAEYGYHEARGSFSDIAAFNYQAPEVPMLNLSVGFQHEHTSKETLNLNHLRHSIYAVTDIIKRQPPLWSSAHDPKWWKQNFLADEDYCLFCEYATDVFEVTDGNSALSGQGLLEDIPCYDCPHA